MSMNNEPTETVEVSVETAEVAQNELQMLIETTNAVEDGGDAMTPLARAKQRIEEERDDSTGVDYEQGLTEAIRIIEEVGEETGEEIAPVDPLTDAIFRASSDLDLIFTAEEARE